MKKSFLIIIALAAIFIVSSLLVANSSGKSGTEPSCIEIKDECCLKKKPTPTPGGMIWETLPREFLNISLITP
jgi:hypothetical protein